MDPWHAAQSVPHRVITIGGLPTVWLEGPQGGDEAEVVGEAFHHAQIVRVTGGKPCDEEQIPVSAWLIPEPNSPLYGANAIAIWIGGGKVGYLQREWAAVWSPIVHVYYQRYGCHCACHAKIMGGGKAEDGKTMNYEIKVILPRWR